MLNRLKTKVILDIMIKRAKKSIKKVDMSTVDAVKRGQDLLLKIMDDNKDTEYGKKYNFANIHSIEEYQKNVPLSDFDDYDIYIKRMVEQKEKNLITVYPIANYAMSSGSVGVPKIIPVSKDTADLYAQYGFAMKFAVVDEAFRLKNGKGFPRRRGALLMESQFINGRDGKEKGAVSSNLLQSIIKFLPYITSVPIQAIIHGKELIDVNYLRARYTLEDRNITFMAAPFMSTPADFMGYVEKNWQMITNDIENGTIDSEIKMPELVRETLQKKLVPNASRANELRKEFEKGFDSPIIPRIWPKFSFVISIGTGAFSSYTKKMKQYTGDKVVYHLGCYAASEAFFAEARHVNEDAFVLLPESGFYEFIPVDSDTDEALTIDKLEVGKDYEIILTNLSGLYRYRIKDVIRVKGFYNQSPLVEFVYRKGQMINITGEKTNEESVRWTIEQFENKTGCKIADYSVYADIEHTPGRYIMLVEPEKPIPKEKLESYCKILEGYLGQANTAYGFDLKEGVLGHMALRVVQPETYALYRDIMYEKGVSANQLKPVRVIDNPKKEKFFFALLENYDEE